MSQPGIPPPQPMGAIRLTGQGSVTTTTMITPKVRVNGYQVPSRHGALGIFGVPVALLVFLGVASAVLGGS